MLVASLSEHPEEVGRGEGGRDFDGEGAGAGVGGYGEAGERGPWAKLRGFLELEFEDEAAGGGVVLEDRGADGERVHV